MVINIDTIKKALYELDITGLLAFPYCAPPDLYDGTAQRIYERLVQIDQPLILTVRNIISNVIADRFDAHYPDEIFDLPAKQILGLTDEHLCPICRKSVFPERSSYDVCDICGWEDDILQDEDHTYSGGANYPSVNQAQMHLWLYENESTSAQMLDAWKEFLNRRREIYSEHSAPDTVEDTRRLDDALRGANSVLLGTLIRLYSGTFPEEQRLSEENRAIEWLSKRKR